MGKQHRVSRRGRDRQTDICARSHLYYKTPNMYKSPKDWGITPPAQPSLWHCEPQGAHPLGPPVSMSPSSIASLSLPGTRDPAGSHPKRLWGKPDPQKEGKVPLPAEGKGTGRAKAAPRAGEGSSSAAVSRGEPRLWLLWPPWVLPRRGGGMGWMLELQHQPAALQFSLLTEHKMRAAITIHTGTGMNAGGGQAQHRHCP